MFFLKLSFLKLCVELFRKAMQGLEGTFKHLKVIEFCNETKIIFQSLQQSI